MNVKYCPGDEKFKNKLVKKLRNIIDENTIIVCIGSANVYGDSLGPRIGSTLKELNFPLIVFGTMENPMDISMMTSMMSECAKSFERLPIILHADILRNIIYSGVWTKYEYIQLKKKKRTNFCAFS